ncbi:glyoxalase [Clostridia bacterium]|nr:glyoxalase [Clostridia bacterium]
MITGIAHAAYVAGDMEKTLHFYCGQLGFKHAFSLAGKDGEPWIEYVKAADGQFLEFFYAKEGYKPQNGSYLHLCLQVDDIHGEAARLTAAGVFLRVKPTQGMDGNWQCWADDPDGNAIEFMQIDPSSPQANA